MGDLMESSRIAPLPVTGPETKEMQPHSSSKGNNITFFRTCFMRINTLFEGGWLSLILLFIVAIACCYTGILLQRCMKSNSLVKTYPDIRHLTFRYWERLLISIFMYLELYVVSIEFLILEGDHLEKFFFSANFSMGIKDQWTPRVCPDCSLYDFTHNVVAKHEPLHVDGWGVSLRRGGWLRGMGWSFDWVEFHEKGRLVNWSGMPITVSLYAFCFCGLPVFTTLYTSMNNRTKFSNVSEL